jgi:glutamate-1-semialdehyde 2,1-aminomutase
VETIVLPAIAAAVAAALLGPRAWRRLELSRAKHRSLAGHSRWSRRFAKQVPFYEYGDDMFFSCDNAPEDIIAQRRAGFGRLAVLYKERFAATVAAGAGLEDGVPDVRFTARYRVPFQFREKVRRELKGGGLLQSADGVQVTDLDGNRFYDLTGSYGVNLLGVDFYRQCIERGSRAVEALGPVLGPFHPVVVDNVRRLKAISGLDDVSFHMSGTEAVMQAVRLARYHTGRRRIVRFCGAYHGWWGEVQPGVGNPHNEPDTLTLSDMSERTLKVLEGRKDIACVLVNPLQALHPNANAPGDSQLVDSSRRAAYDREAYTQWLRRLREVCTRRGIVFILDEVFLGFRLARGGAQEYFGVKADLVTYGKTLGGGLPVGVVCGTRRLMQRYREDRPADICFARGTFNSHPYVMGAMDEFLRFMETDTAAGLYIGLDETWHGRAAALNAQLMAASVPVSVVAMTTVWTVNFTRPGRYNWMLQYYLRAQGLALSWVGSGRFIFSLNYTQADFDEVARRFVAAAREMLADGWFWHDGRLTDKAIRRQILKEMLQARWRA